MLTRQDAEWPTYDRYPLIIQNIYIKQKLTFLMYQKQMQEDSPGGRLS